MRPIFLLLLAACSTDTDTGGEGHGPIAEGILAPLGEPMPSATAEQLATFKRGKEVAKRRFDSSTGLGPGFNVSFCAACHEKPVFGGSAGMYRNFFIAGRVLEDGSFFFGSSAGNASGVVRINYAGAAYDARPAVPDSDNVFAQRNPIPFFGMGLIAEIDDEEILRRADPDDADGDGISGRPNYDRGYVGKFGMKAQTVSIEAFIRGPLNNHVGITSNPLSDEQRARLPVDSSTGSVGLLDRLLGPSGPTGGASDPFHGLSAYAQAAAPDGPLTDTDAIPDPELSSDDLFDLVSFAMLLGAPPIETPTGDALAGQAHFDELGCAACHAPRLQGPRGPVPIYSDLLLHDMGDDLADGIVQGFATAREFRTQPLWGVAAEGPYLHDGRAQSLDDAIRLHGGEGQESRDRYAALDAAAQAEVVAFLLSLGGADQATTGLLPPAAPVPAAGEFGGPATELSGADLDAYVAGRERFDHDFGVDDGVGNPRFNGDSCRACHFDPVIGGSGPRDLAVMRHGIVDADGSFIVPTIGTVLHRETALLGTGIEAQAQVNVYEPRNTPALFGLGLVDAIPDAVIEALADPDDTRTPDGISGRVSRVDGGRLGRFGWKAQVPTLAEFVRDAVATELGMTLPREDGLTFGRIYDNDDVADPELSQADADLLLTFLSELGPPPRPTPADADAVARGEVTFSTVGCDLCHVPVLEGDRGAVAAYSDFLLHDILPAGSRGIEDGSAEMGEFRTAPLWGIAESKPYFHDGASETVADAIERHDGEGLASREAYDLLTPAEQADLLAFVESR